MVGEGDFLPVEKGGAGDVAREVGIVIGYVGEGLEAGFGLLAGLCDMAADVEDGIGVGVAREKGAKLRGGD